MWVVITFYGVFVLLVPTAVEFSDASYDYQVAETTAKCVLFVNYILLVTPGDERRKKFTIFNTLPLNVM